MKARYFDDWSRTLGTGRRRRDIVRGVAIGVVFGLVGRRSEVEAQQGEVLVGGICTSNEDCFDDLMGSSPVCAENGLSEDGLLTCCRESGCCSSDADCCGIKLCAPSGDVCSYCATPPFPTQYPGQACIDDSECVASVVGTVICGPSPIDASGVTVCCYDVGSFCHSDKLCCGSLLCLDGQCG
jgi:hypothetical protein